MKKQTKQTVVFAAPPQTWKIDGPCDPRRVVNKLNKLQLLRFVVSMARLRTL